MEDQVMGNDESKITFRFDETMQGFIFPEITDFETGYHQGKEKDCECEIDCTIKIAHMKEFVTLTGHEAELTGAVSVAGLGEKLKIEKGVFTIFQISKDPQTGRTQKTMEYKINFNSQTGEPYYLYGIKKLYYHTDKFDPIHQMTTLYTTIFKGDSQDANNIFAAGILHFKLTDVFSLVRSMSVEGTDSLATKTRITAQFFDFCYEEALEIYFNRIGFFYRTDYQNFVLSGKCQVNGNEHHMFFYGGAHNQGFPWGDPQTFWDIALILSSPAGESLERYLIAKTSLENMKIEINDSGSSVFSYTGKLYRLTKGYQVSFSDDLADPDQSGILEPVDADIRIDFNAMVPKQNNQEVPAVILPLAICEGLENPLLLYMDKLLKKYASSTHGLGIRIGIRPVKINQAVIKVAGKDVVLQDAQVLGEAERSTFNFVREPTLYYNYFCGINPDRKKITVHIEGDVLYNETTYYTKTLFDHVCSALTHPFNNTEVRLKNDEIEQIEHSPKPLKIKDGALLEVNYDHFDTAVFQRRVVLLQDAANRNIWALEEDMKRINLKRIPPAKQKQTIESPLDQVRSLVAVYQSRRPWPLKDEAPLRDRPGIRDNIESLFDLNRQFIPGAISEKHRIEMENNDKKELLRKVVQRTKFIQALEKRAADLNKNPGDLKIVIKPNFMFLYNKKDHTTYTDPVLVKELIDLMYHEGFTNIAVVEAHSTYGEYFQNRNVPFVANYIGLDGSDGKYGIVDLTEDQQIDPDVAFKGPLKGQKVPKTWADADFRISFAKNKTHSYAYYTLTIKCIYGALPLANKFKEYHCDRGIYATTIEYLLHYPVHFGFIDAYISADGPFGIFADKTPNYTRTIIGGENIVAVDWVGASKMGYNPLLSEYMKKAVEQFGKPRIDLRGDLKDEIYHPWINVPVELSVGLNDMLDRHYKFGNIMYSALSNMDEKAFPRKADAWWMKALRLIDKPLRDMFFVQASSKLIKQIYNSGSFDKPDHKAFKDVTLDK